MTFNISKGKKSLMKELAKDETKPLAEIVEEDVKTEVKPKTTGNKKGILPQDHRTNTQRMNDYHACKKGCNGKLKKAAKDVCCKDCLDRLLCKRQLTDLNGKPIHEYRK